MPKLNREKRRVAAELVASRMRARGLEVRGPIEVVGVVAHKDTVTVTYWHEGKLRLQVVRNVP